ncbi:MAG: hypothetical protein DMG70_30405 [Acidobacteria bacterium]|nr:MAG: hypothetical protein DMG70_30405 [Acidobacteriota bacterium]
MSTAFPLLRTSAMRVAAAELIRKGLIEGKFRPGESLSEPALAAELGVSRGPVREALLVLAQEGLIVHNQNRGFSVPKLGPEDHRLITVVQLPLETQVLILARERARELDIRTLEEIKKRLVDISLKKLNALVHLEFHERIWELSRNPWLEAALRRIMVPFFAFTSMVHSALELNPQLLDKQHQLYLDFLQGNSTMTAEECVRFHFQFDFSGGGEFSATVTSRENETRSSLKPKPWQD